METRQRWSTKSIYILAAIGAAAGLGNLWRFPMLAYEFGGSSFIIAMLISNIIIIYPLMLFETAIGQRFQSSGPISMEKFKKGSGWIYYIPIFATFFMVTYYTPVMAWALKYLFKSFSGEFLEAPSSYFMTDIIGLTSGINEIGNWQIGVFIFLIISYVLILLSLRNGIKSVSKVIIYTATIPFILLIILIIRGVTLPGAEIGLRALFIPDWNTLLDIKLWQAAIGQSFFSAALATGYFTMSGSYRKPNAEIPKSSIWILTGNFCVSILSGIAVFSTLGFMAVEQGVPLSEAATGGPMLIFTVFPSAIAMMPNFNILFAVLLFVTVITLAIDSIFAAIEIIATGLLDIFPNLKSHFRATMIVVSITFILGIPLTFGSGLYYLDILDHFIGGYIFMFIGILESIVLVFFVGTENIRNWINKNASTNIKIGKWFNYTLYIIPFVLLYIFSFSLINEFQAPYSNYPMWSILLFGIIPFIIVFGLTIILRKLNQTDEKK